MNSLWSGFRLILYLTILHCSFWVQNASSKEKSFYSPSSWRFNGTALMNAFQLMNRRSQRYLFPFAVINFPPEPCSPTNTQFTDGVCLSKKRCVASGGETVGTCQQGLGTCCKFVKQCFSNRRSVTVVETVENLMSANMAGSCEFVFPKQPGICQVRLDFANVMLQEAHTFGRNAGNCQSESLTVIGAANLNGALKVCGRLTGQHMILSYGSTSDLISVIVHSEMLSAIYSVRATQIPCNSPHKAPDDCLQYYTSTTAAIKSFGFPRQLNSQRYTICVKPNSGGTALSWDRCTDTDAESVMLQDRFRVSQQTLQTDPCLTDWIAIDAEKRCGNKFLPITTGMGSHARIRVNFDENEMGNDLFNVSIPISPTNPLDPSICQNILLEQQVFPNPPRNLCDFAANNVCQCKFSSIPDASALGLTITNLPVQTDPNLPEPLCPRIEGYTPEVERVSGQQCKYLANIRVTDINNTGFCLRYQAM